MSQLKFRILIDFRISVEKPSVKPLTNEEYGDKTTALFAEIEGKIRAMGLPTLSREDDTSDLCIPTDSFLKTFTHCSSNIFEHWIIRNPCPEQLYVPNCNSFYKFCLWTPWLTNSAESFNSLRKVFQMLNNDYDILFSLDWESNDCVMEVHVAQVGGNFALQEFRNMMAFLWFFEKKLDGLHEAREVDDGRTDWTHRQSLRNNCALSWSSQLKPLTSEEELDKIFACESMNEVDDLTDHPDPRGSFVYGIDKRWTDFDETGFSVEAFKFEQERPTLDVDRIENWLKVCFVIVKFASKVKTTADMRRFIISRTEDNAYTCFLLLTDIGLQEQAAYYRAVAVDRDNKQSRVELDALSTEVDAFLPLCNSECTICFSL
ncbi:hypothetical protein ONS95_008758 [Cadophora gregata]|uniref:uncharacterized protein n=1 Tax=Cadophora gregata TaxID=51156 RepID=UPI0026DC63E0|nr:uncharacterized protein ONS95_008758 [Cadophora gregata]KAK0123751.1 hypothetical protein ONS95_008758 [Cadophora gregata]KAK0130093.1 hypothetical protein ONS96_000628 [Cadophora gregata f. sp. sojae]